MWQKEIDNTIRFEKSVQGHPQIAKHITDHVPGKTAKQIRRTLEAVLQSPCRILTRPKGTQQLRNQYRAYARDTKESKTRPVPTRLYVSEPRTR